MSPLNKPNSPWRYYVVSATAGHETLRLRKITHVGWISAFVLKCNLTTRAECANFALPNFTHYTYKIAAENNQLDIERQDDSNCFYIFGIVTTDKMILGTDSYATYQLSVTKQNNLLLLQSGIPVIDHVDGGGGYDYFYFIPNSIASTTIRLTITFGDADLFVSTKIMRPGPGNR